MTVRSGDFDGKRTRKQGQARERKLVIRNRWYAGGVATLLSAAMMFTAYAPAMAETTPTPDTSSSTPDTTSTPDPSSTPDVTATPSPSPSSSTSTAPQTKTAAKAPSGTANAANCTNQGGFEIDGDLTANTCGGDDWSSVAHNFTTQAGTYKVVKDNSNPAGWESGGATPPKVDFTGVYTYAHNTGGHYYLDVAWEREQTSGTGGYVIEVTNSGVHTGNGVPQPDRSHGGAVFYITTQGSSAPQLLQSCIYTSTADYPGTCTSGQGGFVGAVSTADISSLAGDGTSRTIPAGGFFEVGLDVTTLSGGVIAPGCPAPGQATAYMRSFTGENFGPTGNLKGWVGPADLTPPTTCGSLDIVKHDAHGAALAGAQFTVSPDPTTGTGSKSVTTTASGDFLFSGNVKPGTYTVTETKAPAGYLLADPASQTVTVGVQQTKSVTFVDPLGQVSWLKQDQDQALLGGATFTVTATGGAAAAAPWSLNTNPITVTDNAGRDTDPTAGKFTIADLPAGTYSVKETAAPAGYRLDTTSQSFTIDQTHQSVTLGSAFVNTLITHTIKLQKTWIDGIEGDTAKLTMVGAAGTQTATSIANGQAGSWTDPTNTVSETVPLGSTVTLSELVSGTGKYGAALTCDEGVVPVDGSFTVPDADVTCTWTNKLNTATLTLVKNLDYSAFTGAAVPGDWDLSADGISTLTGKSGVSGVVTAGSYDLSEAIANMGWQTNGYNLTSLVCESNNSQKSFSTSVANATVSLAEGDNVTCTFTNTPTPAKWTIHKSSDKGLQVLPGDTIHYEITVTHDPSTSWPGSVSLPNVDNLTTLAQNATFVPGTLAASFGTPTLVGNELSWSADLSDVPAGSSFTISYDFKVNADAWGVDLPNALTPPTQFSCVPDASGCTTDSKTPDLVQWKTSEVTAKPDPNSDSDHAVLPGGQVTYTLHVLNDSDVAMPAGQTVTDDLSNIIDHVVLGALPAGLAYDGDRTLTWTLGELQPGDEATVSFTVTVKSDAGGYDLTNVLIPGVAHCPTGETSDSCTTRDHVPHIDLGIVKTANNEGPVDDTASSHYSYSLSVTNNSDEDVVDATVTDTLPSLVSLDTSAGTNGFDLPSTPDVPADWTASVDAGGKITVSIPSMKAGDTRTITVYVVVKPVVHNQMITVDPKTKDNPDPKVPDPIIPDSTIHNEACVAVANDTDGSNNCSSVDVPQKAVEANIYVQCAKDVPYLHYDIRATSNLAGLPVTLTWTPSAPGTGGVPATDLPASPTDVTKTLKIGDSGSILWPGAAVLPSGLGVGFPGWRPIVATDYDANGVLKFAKKDTFAGLVYDPSTVASDAWRYQSTVTISVNPTTTYTVTYPPANPDCAALRTTDLTITKTASVEHGAPGSTFDYDMVVNNVNLGAASPVTLKDPIPASLKVNSITTSTTDFPRWENCKVTGQDAAGYGGTLTCDLFGPLMLSTSAPDVKVNVTVDPNTTVSAITNTATVDWANFDNSSQTGSAESAVTITVPQPLALTGGTLPIVALILGILAVLAGAGAVILGRRRRGEKAAQL